jgi:enoyl-CoA hydratase/carnithine racemase
MSAFMVMTGLPLTAFEALQAGLIVKVVEENQLGKVAC